MNGIQSHELLGHHEGTDCGYTGGVQDRTWGLGRFRGHEQEEQPIKEIRSNRKAGKKSGKPGILETRTGEFQGRK